MPEFLTFPFLCLNFQPYLRSDDLFQAGQPQRRLAGLNCEIEVAGQHHRVSSIIYIEKQVLFKSREKSVTAFPHLESFAPCFRDPPPGAVSVGMLREVHLAASRRNRVKTNAQGMGFRAVHRGPGTGSLLSARLQKF